MNCFCVSEAICDHDQVSGISVLILANKQDVEVRLHAHTFDTVLLRLCILRVAVR